ncbi:1970_t:CDS:2 [Entrophospora sp. SA101]|nr:1970_t:CDS:2 [Entrophospora sp. SA101]
MKSNHAREVEESKQLIKKELTPDPYLYNIPEPGERFECIVVEREDQYDEYGKKILWKVGDCMEYPDVAKKLNKKIDVNYYLKSVVGLCARFINKQKSAERWIKNYIKDLRDAPKKDEAIISHLWKNATTHAEKICSSISKVGITRPSGASTWYNGYLNALDKIADSIRLKLSDLLLELSKLNVEYRNGLYKLIMKSQKCKTDITILEEYILRYNLETECEALTEFQNTWYKAIGLEIARVQAVSIMQSSKKDDSSEADVDEIIDLYC